MKWLRRVPATLAEAVIAGALVGLLEGTALVIVSPIVGGADRLLAAWGASAALAAAAATVVALVLLVAAGLLAQTRIVADWWAALLAGGDARARLVWRVLVGGAAALLFAAAGFKFASRAYVSYPDREPALFGLLMVGGFSVLGAVAAFAAAAVDRAFGERVAGSSWATKLLSGRRAWIAVALLALAVTAAPLIAISIAIPDMYWQVAIGGCSLIVVLAGLRALRVGHRRAAYVTAGGLAVAIAAGLMAVPRSPQGRAAVAVHGLVSAYGFRTLSRFGDRDGDHYAAAFVGGADCDDTDAGRNPARVEVAGNGVDENCTGEDASAAAVEERWRAPAPARPAARHNIVLISVDALRADHVGAWGYSRPTTPVIDRLAAEGTRFTWAFTPTPATRPALAALLTGRYPSSLVWRGGMKLSMDKSAAKSLAEVLAAAGYHTAAITCCDRFAKPYAERTGFAELDATADTLRLRRPGGANGDQVARRARYWLTARAEKPSPFFLWVHFYEPHAPYGLPDGAPRFGDRPIDMYDSEIAFADQQIGQLVDVLKQHGLREKTIVVVTADHGEEFQEHGISAHARSLYNQVARVPFVIVVPGASPRTSDTPVSLVDVMPTLLDLVGVDAPAGMNGRSLAATVGGQPAPVRPVLMDIVPNKYVARDLIGIAVGTWKVIWDRESNSWSMYSLAEDPADLDDRALHDEDVLAQLRDQLFDTIDRELSVAQP